MLIYILKFSACLFVFLLFYKLVLEQERMHQFKRAYLLAILLISLSIPLITFNVYVEPAVVLGTFQSPIMNTVFYPEVIEAAKVNYIPMILWSIYGFGASLLFVKFCINLSHIFISIQRNPKHKSNRFINVLLQDLAIPHTFFNYIFLNKSKFETNQIPEEVLLHEETHAKQKHSIDILIIELLQVIFWFNPLIYLTKHAIKLNHEFLADQAVLLNGIQPSQYQYLLLAFSSNAQHVELANAINYSSIKKRFTVMKTHTSKQKKWLRSLLLLPLVALTLYGFSEKKEVVRQVPNSIIKNKNGEVIPLKEFVGKNSEWSVNSTLSYEDSPIQQQATPKEVAEYNKLAKQYNAQPKEKRVVKLEDLNRLEAIYKKMSKEQKEASEPFPNIVPPPPPPAPKVIKGEVAPPPPPIPANATPAQKKKMQAAVDNYDNKVPPPPPPPAPKSPLDHVIEMAKNGALFYSEGKSISSDEAISLLKKNDELNIQIKESDSKQPKVYITKAPIKL